MGTGGADGAADIDAFVAAEVVQHDDVAWLEGWQEELLDPGEEDPGVDRAVHDAGRIDAIRAQCGEEGHCRPMTMRHPSQQALSARRPAMAAGHVCLGPGLIDEHQAGRVYVPLMATPAFALAGDVRPMLLGGVQAFF